MMRRFRSLAIGCVALSVSLAAITAASAQTMPLEIREEGVGKPPPGAGMGTKAALNNPKCNPDSVPGWGTVPFVTETSGPFCVAPAPEDNGGKTAPGVTADSIKVVVVVPNAQQIAGAASKPANLATGTAGTVKDAILDYWAPYAAFFEQWGRTVDWVFVESSGDDETAQRADAVRVVAEKPFAVGDATPVGLGILQQLTAKAKIMTIGNSAVTAEDTIAQAPYRWGVGDSQAGAILTAEYAGKQLAKHPAAYAGDDSTKTKTRAFGAVYNTATNIDQFTKEFQKYGGKLAAPPLEYTTSGGFLGDATTAAPQAQTVVAKLKSAGVTSVLLFSDYAMNKAMFDVANTQDYHPEWILTSYQFADLVQLGRNYNQEQYGHAFGLSALGPYTTGVTTQQAFDWYWGPGAGTTFNFANTITTWLALGLHYAGPTLTPENFKRGMFAVPGRQSAYYGKTAGTPYDEYFSLGTRVGLFWYDPNTTGTSMISANLGKGVSWFVGGTQRYSPGDFPTKPVALFKESNSAWGFDSPQTPLAKPVPCPNCPSAGGPGSPSSS